MEKRVRVGCRRGNVLLGPYTTISALAVSNARVSGVEKTHRWERKVLQPVEFLVPGATSQARPRNPDQDRASSSYPRGLIH
jgi:hypothetical protein